MIKRKIKFVTGRAAIVLSFFGNGHIPFHESLARCVTQNSQNRFFLGSTILTFALIHDPTSMATINGSPILKRSWHSHAGRALPPILEEGYVKGRMNHLNVTI